MLFVLICAYLGVWGCAYATARSWPGRPGFWVFYAVAVGVVPPVSGLCLMVLFRLVSPDYGATITPLPILIGMGVAAVAYPIKYLRSKVEE